MEHYQDMNYKDYPFLFSDLFTRELKLLSSEGHQMILRHLYDKKEEYEEYFSPFARLMVHDLELTRFVQNFIRKENNKVKSFFELTETGRIVIDKLINVDPLLVDENENETRICQ